MVCYVYGIKRLIDRLIDKYDFCIEEYLEACDYAYAMFVRDGNAKKMIVK